jgi:hypothetical protein
MTYEIGRFLDVEWRVVGPDYDLKPNEYYYSRILKSISDLELTWELQRLGLKDVREYEKYIARSIWDEVRRRGDEPKYVMASLTPPTSELQPYWFLETRVQALHKGSTPIAVIIGEILALVIAIGILAGILYYVFTGKVPEFIPKEVWYSVIAGSIAITTYAIYKIIRGLE